MKPFSPEELKRSADRSLHETKKYFAKLKKSKPDKLDESMSTLHDEAFEEIDCLECANCCKTTSPAFYERDIERLADYLKIRPAVFVEKYLTKDEDGDYVLTKAPCPFLGADNYCSVYEARPLACREYPHTNRKKFYQILDLTLRNTFICPAAFQIVERLKKEFKVR